MTTKLNYRTSEPEVKNVLAFCLGLQSLNNEQAGKYSKLIFDTHISDNIKNQSEHELADFLHNRKMLSFWSLASPELRLLFPNVEALHEAMSIVTKIRLEQLIPVFSKLRDNDIDVIPYKGIDFIYNYPNSSGNRFISDIDPLVKREQLLQADDVLQTMGFQQGDIDRSKAISPQKLAITPITKEEKEWVINNHHETHPYVSFSRVEELEEYRSVLERYTKIYDSGEPIVTSYIDLHQSIAAGFDENDIWVQTTQSDVNGQSYTGLAPEVYLCLLLGRSYTVTNVYNDPTICAFIDGMRVVLAKRIDWDKLFVLSEKYKLHAPFYYCLSHIHVILGEENIPYLQVERYRNALLCEREFDLGDFFPKLLGYL